MLATMLVTMLFYLVLINLLVPFYNILFHITFKSKNLGQIIFEQVFLSVYVKIVSRYYFRTSNSPNILDRNKLCKTNSLKKYLFDISR